MFLSLSILSFIGLGQLLNGTYEQCAPPEFYTNLGIQLGDRSALRDVIFARPDWDSAVSMFFIKIENKTFV